MAEHPIHSNDDAREAIKSIAKAVGLSVTALATQAGISTGSINRFVFARPGTKNGVKFESVNMHLLSLIRVMEGAGYELVVRPKETGSRRSRRLAALKERNGDRQAVRPDPS
jgi:hypothetical protein